MNGTSYVTKVVASLIFIKFVVRIFVLMYFLGLKIGTYLRIHDFNKRSKQNLFNKS